jgi:hypothetical protein
MFAGNTGFYHDAHFVERLYGVPSRDRCVQWLLSNRKDAVVVDTISGRQKLFSRDSTKAVPCLMICTTKGDRHRWFEELGSTDFFLCLPGSHMLMCHNAIEAMAVGCIPILSYKDWFVPALREGVNCLSYRTVEELGLAIDRALSMSAAEIENLRRCVLDYYRSTLDPVQVSARLAEVMRGLSRIHVYVNQEECDTLRRAHSESVLHKGGTLQSPVHSATDLR